MEAVWICEKRDALCPRSKSHTGVLNPKPNAQFKSLSPANRIPVLIGKAPTGRYSVPIEKRGIVVFPGSLLNRN